MEPRFSGHETFPLRYGWLNKSVNFMICNENFRISNNSDVEKAIVQLGVGKNMVSAIRYWSESCGIIEVDKGISSQNLSGIGNYLFTTNTNSAAYGETAKDPYLEKRGTVWLVHFLLNFNEHELTAYRYFFNLSSLQQFDKDKLVQDVESDANRLCAKEVKVGSIKKDVDCFLHTYCSKSSASKKTAKTISEEHFSSPLSELKLIADLGKNHYVALFEERPDLPTEIFVYGLLRFITQTRKSMTASFDSLLADQNSPGKIFRLSEKGLGVHLDDAAKKYPSILKIEDSQGLRQVRVLKQYTDHHDFFEILDDYYGCEQ
tara:strand:- start:17779 stop:18732 length:954 start_codon:yes stop_codon:yes gene_type:complete